MPRLLAPIALLLVASSCVGSRNLTDPTLRVYTDGGAELGVSTTYGIVFLGRTATSGRVEVEAIFGDGPSIEGSVIEPIGGALFTAETEIRLPAVRLHFESPNPGDELLLAGRSDEGPWESETTVRRDPRIYGLLVDVPSRLDGRSDQVGAGLYWVNPDNKHDKRLVGLAAGKVTVQGTDGPRTYLAVVGPEHLWRLVTHRRDLLRSKPWIYREDVM